MPITKNYLANDKTFKQFIEEHHLEVIIYERPRNKWNGSHYRRYCATIQNAQLDEGTFTSCVMCDGNTPEVALAGLAAIIVGETLILVNNAVLRCPSGWALGAGGGKGDYKVD